MASRSNLGGQGGVEMKIDGDTTPLLNKIAEAKATIEAENKFTEKVNDRDAALRERQAKVIAGLKKESDAVTAAAEARKQAILNEAMAAADAMKATGDSASNAAKQAGGFSGAVQAGSVALNGLRYALGAVTFAVGAIGGVYALFTSRMEEHRKKIEETTKGYEALTRSQRELQNEFLPKNLDDVEAAIAKINERYDEQRLLIYDTKLSQQDYADAAERNLKERIEAEERVYKAAEERGRAARSRVAQAERVQALEDKKALDASIAEDQARRNKDLDKRMQDAEDFKNKLKDLTEKMAADQAEAAQKTRQAWVDAFTQIRTASNEVFGSNRAMGDVGVSSALTSMNTRSGASNRITFDGGN